MKELANCNTEIFEIQGSEYAFDFVNYEIYKVDAREKKVFEFLIRNREMMENRDFSKEMIRILLKIKKGFFFSENQMVLTKKDSNDYIISYPICHACNLRCKYCFAEGGENYKGKNRLFEISEINYILDFLTYVSEGNIDTIRLEFVSGGETLLFKDSYIEIINHLIKEAQKRGFKLNIFTLTNGTTLDKNIIDYINENSIHLGVSLDGPKEIQDYQRPYANGEGSYDTVEENIKNVILKSNYSNNIWIVSVITSRTQSLVEILKHHKEEGIMAMEMRLVRGKDPYNLALSLDNINHFKALFRELSDYLKENKEDIKMILNKFDTFGKLINSLFLGRKIEYRCEAGKRKFSFNADGDVYPCDSFASTETFKIGNIYTKEINTDVLEQFKNMSIYHSQKCRQCAFRYLCGGECYYNEFVTEEDPENNLYCDLQIYLCKLAIDIVYELGCNDPAKYQELRTFAKFRDLYSG